MSRCACLIVEGLGDVQEIPSLLRRVFHHKASFDFKIATKPIECKGILTKINKPHIVVLHTPEPWHSLRIGKVHYTVHYLCKKDWLLV